MLFSIKEKAAFNANTTLNQLVFAKTLDARMALVNTIDDGNLHLLYNVLAQEFKQSVENIDKATKLIAPLFNHPIDTSTIHKRCMNLIYKTEVPGFKVSNYKPIPEEYDANPQHWDNFRQLALIIVKNFNLQLNYPDCKEAIHLALLSRGIEYYSAPQSSSFCTLI